MTDAEIQVSKKWWTGRWFVFITLVPLWPISLWFLWKSRELGTTAKIVWTLASAALVLWLSTALIGVTTGMYEQLDEIMKLY